MEELIKRAKEKDEEAIVQLLEKLKPIRKALIKNFPKLESEDLEQELIILVLEGVESYNPEASEFPYYLKQLSRYKALDMVKELEEAISLETVISCDGEEITIGETLEAGVNVEREYEEKILKFEVRKALERLEKSEREILILYYFKDLNLKEIGEICGKSTATICKKKKEAERKLRKILKERLNDNK